MQKSKVSSQNFIKSWKTDLRRNGEIYLVALPVILFFILFHYKSMYGVIIAFKNFSPTKGIMGSDWVGFKYFERIFKAHSFLEVLRNTLVISSMKLIFTFPMPIILAVFINEIRNERMKKLFQTFSYLPHFISWVIAASLITELVSLNGPINAIIEFFGGNPIFFRVSKEHFRGLLVVTDIWKGVGWGSIVYVAAITGIDQQLYEAARIDGAKKLQEIWHITLPSIRPTIITLFIFAVGGLMSAGFDQIYNLYSGAVYEVADVLDTFVYRNGIGDGNYSYATAAGLFQNVIGFALLIVTNFIVKKLSDGEEGIW